MLRSLPRHPAGPRVPVYVRSAELGAPFSHKPTVDLRGQITEAARRAVDAAGLSPNDIDALYMAAMGGFGHEAFVNLLPLRVGSDLALRRADILPMMVGTSEAGAWALRQAVEALRHGTEYETILVVAGEQMNPLAEQKWSRDERAAMRERRNAVISQVVDDQDRAFGLNMVRIGDLFMDLLVARLGLCEHDVRNVLLPNLALEKYKRARRYSYAQYHRAPVTSWEDYARYGSVTRWFNLHDVTPTTTGAVALVLSTTPPSEGPEVQVRGMGQSYVPTSIAQRRGDPAVSATIVEAILRVCRETGATLETLRSCDFAIVHDAFPSIELFFLKELGLETGELIDRWLSGWSNPFGGLKACGHALGASGMLQVAKAHQRFTTNTRYLVPDDGPAAFPWGTDRICFTTSVGAALTNVIVTLLTADHGDGHPDPLNASLDEELPAQKELQHLYERTADTAGYERSLSVLGDTAGDPGAIVASTRLQHRPGFGDGDSPLMAARRSAWVHLVQKDPGRSEGDKVLAFSDDPIEHGRLVSLQTVEVGGALLVEAQQIEGFVDSLRRTDVASTIMLGIAAESHFGRWCQRPLTILDEPLELLPCTLAYARIGDVERGGGLTQLRYKARITSSRDVPSVSAVAPVGSVVTITLLRPHWEVVSDWLTALWHDCEHRRGLSHPALPTLYDWGVLPSHKRSLVGSSLFADLADCAELRDSGAVIYLVRAYVTGSPLGADGQPAPSIRDFQRDAAALCDAVTLLHDQGLFGRGITPERVVRAPGGRLVLLDSPWAELPESSGELADDGRSEADLVGLGRVLFRLYTGVLPRGSAADIRAIMRVNARTDVAHVLGRMVSPSAGQRFSSVAELSRSIASL